MANDPRFGGLLGALSDPLLSRGGTGAITAGGFSPLKSMWDEAQLIANALINQGVDPAIAAQVAGEQMIQKQQLAQQAEAQSQQTQIEQERTGIMQQQAQTQARNVDLQEQEIRQRGEQFRETQAAGFRKEAIEEANRLKGAILNFANQKIQYRDPVTGQTLERFPTKEEMREYAKYVFGQGDAPSAPSGSQSQVTASQMLRAKQQDSPAPRPPVSETFQQMGILPQQEQSIGGGLQESAMRGLGPVARVSAKVVGNLADYLASGALDKIDERLPAAKSTTILVLRRLRERMNQKGADREAVINEFLNESPSVPQDIKEYIISTFS